MRIIKKSTKLRDVCYDIRGPVLEKAKQMEDNGETIIKLNIGNLGLFGFDPPLALLDNIRLNMSTAAAYSDSKGLLTCREIIRQDMQKQQVNNVHIEDIYVGNGASELIVMSMNALLDNGDEVLIPSPDYPLWTAAVSLSGGKPIHYICDEQADWLPDVEDMRAKITPHTKAIVIINPNNPTGALYSKAVLEDIIELARQHHLIIFSDEIYSQTLYDGAQHITAASLANDVLFITLNGLSKNYQACGYRAGWMVVSGKKDHAKDYIIGLDMLASMRLCSNVLGQLAIQAALTSQSNTNSLVEPNGRLYTQRSLAYNLLTAIPGVTCVKPKAALYLFPKLDPKLYPITDDRDFVYQLLVKEQVLVVQGTGFNWPNSDHFRIVFLPKASELEHAIGKIARFLEYYRQKYGRE
ncbi:MAG: pyridoxal phosphate-dependent aminotransferase [Gammaproteobacteria bacterium]